MFTKKTVITDEMFLDSLLLNNWDAGRAYKSLCSSITQKEAELLGAKRFYALQTSDVYRNLMALVVANVFRLLTSTDEKVSLAMTKSMLDRIYGKVLPVEEGSPEQVLTPLELSELLQELRNAAA